MVPPRNEGDRAEGTDRQDRLLGGNEPEGSRAIGGSGSSGHSDDDTRSRRVSCSLTERRRDIIRDETNGYLLLERSDAEDGVLQWLRALDLQLLGACRADERQKPLLKLNVSIGAAEDRFMAQMSQYFEVSEVGMLARCLCIPLVSIRVGKVNKQGNLLCPTSTRGYLNFSLLPSSNMHISFTGDDGCTERLAVVTNDPESPAAIIEEILADSSGRSFLMKLPESRVLYFWCSERSMLHWIELLAKTKDLLSKKPSLSHLTGISEPRLEYFAAHLRAYLGSSNTPVATSTASSLMVASSLHAAESDFRSKSKSSRGCPTAARTPKVRQGSLSARSSTFKDGTSRNSSCNRSGATERLRGGSCFSLTNINNRPGTSVPGSCKTDAQSTIQCEVENSESSILRSGGSCGSMPCYLPEITCPSSPLLTLSSSDVNPHPSQVTIPGPLFSPYDCWCPPTSSPDSPLQYTALSSPLLMTSAESQPLPPLSSLLASPGPPVSIFPALFPETLVHFPRPVTLPSSHQIPNFTPFMSDPIVHIPIIDVCSVGQGYLVSAGSGISSSVAPLLPSRTNPLISEAESLAEKNARETLRMLMASTPTFTSPQLRNMLPEAFNSTDDNFPSTHASNHAMVVGGSRCLYSGTLDVKARVSGVSFMDFSSLSGKHANGGSTTRGKLERDERGDESEEMELSASPPVSEGSSCARGDLLSD